MKAITHLLALTLIFAALFIELPMPALAAPSNLADATAPGPFATTTAEYQFPANIDEEILPTAATEIWARVFWPTQLAGQRHPILFFLHGNHQTCEDRSTNPISGNCSYTRTGICNGSMKVIANHDGYSYLAKHLASWGYIVVSINANRGITCGGSLPGDWGLNLARGRLILRHLQLWHQWATEGGVPNSLSGNPEAFLDTVDFSAVGLMGHSRGGEGVRAAYNLYRDRGSVWPERIPGLEIRGIFEIGAVDGQTGRVLDADDTAWNQLLPMCDGDIDDFQGRKPFERMIRKKTETRRTPKSLYMVWGTNHNFYNSEWVESDSNSCVGHTPIFGTGPESLQQQKIAIASATSFFLAHVTHQPNTEFAQHFDPLYSVPNTVTEITRIDRAYIPTSDELFNARFESFDRPTGMNSYNVPNDANGITIEHDADTSPKQALLNWKSASANNFLQMNWTQNGQGRAVDAYDTLDFRITRDAVHVQDQTPTDFSIELVDAQGNHSTALPVSRYASVLGPVTSISLFQTVRVPLKDFGLTAGTLVRGVRLTFDRSESGTIQLAHVRFASSNTQNLSLSANAPLPSLEPVYEEENSGAFEVLNDSQLVAERKNALRKSKLFRSTIATTRLVKHSPFAKGSEAIEITMKSQTMFPVGKDLLALVIGNRKFMLSRFPEDDLNTLTFTIPRADFDRLPDVAGMHIEYGDPLPNQIWRLSDFDRESLEPKN